MQTIQTNQKYIVGTFFRSYSPKPFSQRNTVTRIIMPACEEDHMVMRKSVINHFIFRESELFLNSKLQNLVIDELP